MCSLCQLALVGAGLMGAGSFWWVSVGSFPVLLEAGSTPPAGKKVLRTEIPMSEVEKHNNPDGDLWVVINDQVWDLSDFIESHPGGEDPLKRAAGRDGSALFNSLHVGGPPSHTPSAHTLEH